MNQADPQNVRKRILLFYFAAGINLCMAMYVLAAGLSQAGGSTLTVVAFVFLAFAALNFYVARMLRKRLDVYMRGQTPS
jgi:hypothetical protein